MKIKLSNGVILLGIAFSGKEVACRIESHAIMTTLHNSL
jgi:hypothetical protein